MKNITVISQWQDLRNFQTGFTSIYALDVLTHKHGAIINLMIFNKLQINIASKYEVRKGSFLNTQGEEVAYPNALLLDAKIQWTEKKWSVFIEGNNLLNEQYFNRGNIPMPGIWIRGGCTFRFID